MKRIRIAALVMGALLISAAQDAYAQQQKKKTDFGKREYESKCAVCHGVAGKGDGPYKPWLTTSPSDLTVLAKNNGGVFPFDRVYNIIDGRLTVRAHGPADMPIWGADYKAESAYFDVPYDPEAYVRSRILALTEYVSRLQAK
ncbi:MAG TPA: cytochrome c [Burkholderiales bacterium]|nr:cytochrome c [Burkholderiales bacterium]